MHLLCVFMQKDSIQCPLSPGTKSLENCTVKMFSRQSVSVFVGFFPIEEKEGHWVLTSQTATLMSHMYNCLSSMDDYYYHYHYCCYYDCYKSARPRNGFRPDMMEHTSNLAPRKQRRSG